VRIVALLSFLVLAYGGCREPQSNRPFHIINLSLPRTATTSFSGIFGRYPATHEYMIAETVPMLMDYHERRIPPEILQKFLRQRDRRAAHYVDSASFFFMEPEIVIATFPHAKYFLSVRDCESWIASMVDNAVFAHQMIIQKKTTVKLDFLDRYSEFFIKGHSRAMMLDESVLKQNRARIVANLSQVWGEYTLKDLEAISEVNPTDRLVVRIEDFDRAMPDIARLAGIDLKNLNLGKKHLNRDRRLDYYRKLLGPASLKQNCSPWQQRVDTVYDKTTQSK
jgi:hypothetical protein